MNYKAIYTCRMLIGRRKISEKLSELYYCISSKRKYSLCVIPLVVYDDFITSNQIQLNETLKFIIKKTNRIITDTYWCADEILVKNFNRLLRNNNLALCRYACCLRIIINNNGETICGTLKEKVYEIERQLNS